MTLQIVKPYIHVEDANGNPYVGAKLYVYVPGTTTPASIYADAALSIPLANPLAGATGSDAAGNSPRAYIAAGAYKLREFEAQSALKIAEIGRWYEPEKLFAYVTLVFYGKVLLWDKVLALGSTDAVTGEVAHWAGAIMAFYFGKRGIENVARIVGNRFGGR